MFDIKGPLLIWPEWSYVTDTKKKLIENNNNPLRINIIVIPTLGVPQGEHLSPLDLMTLVKA